VDEKYVQSFFGFPQEDFEFFWIFVKTFLGENQKQVTFYFIKIQV
jgi:hypothetical protein